MFCFKFSRLVLSSVLIIIVNTQNSLDVSKETKKSSLNSSTIENYSAPILNRENSNFTESVFAEYKNFTKDYGDINDKSETGRGQELTTLLNEYTDSSFGNRKKKTNSLSLPQGPLEKKTARIISNDNIYRVPKNTNQLSIRNYNGNKDEENIPRSYGISVVLSSDIVSLKKYVEKIEDSLCKNQSLQLIEGLFSGKSWALKMYDASAKSPTGLLWGDTFQLGNFDECLSSRSDTENSPGIPGVEAQYCLANIELEKKDDRSTNISKRTGPRDDVHWAFCVPNSCSSRHVKEFVTNILTISTGKNKVTVEPTFCHSNKPIVIDTKEIVFVSLIGCFIAILIMCTTYHLYYSTIHKNKSNRYINLRTSIILCFSIARNLKKIFSVKEENKLGLDAIAGIRICSMAFILSGHLLLFVLSGPVTNTVFYDEMISRVENALFLNSPLLVDTFLLLSAFLMCRLLLSELDKRKGKVNVIPIYIFRYIRVTFSYFIVIAFYATWLSKLGSGPLWNSKMAIEKERCLESWWANILYINNYVNTDKLCMFQSWYLSVDTQLFFLAPAVIYPLWKWRRIGECILGLCTVVSIVVPFIVTFWNHLDPTLLPFPKEVIDVTSNFYFKEAYIKTHMRATSYSIGLVFGYILYRIQTTGYKFTRSTICICWTASVMGIISSFVSVTIFYQPDYLYNPLNAAIYSALHRLIWSAGTGWLLIACATKNAGFLGNFLSWKPFIPLGRLTYCAYLVNGIIELNAYGTLRNSIHLSVFKLFFLTLSHFIQTLMLALVLSVMFESPIHGFEKILLSTLGRSPRTESAKKIGEIEVTGQRNLNIN